MNQKIMADTSVWIEYFKNKQNIVEFLEDNLINNLVCINGIIAAELIQGIKNEKEREIIRSNIDSVEIIETNFTDWIKIGELSNTLRKNGITLPLTDIAIASLCINNNIMLATADKHFSQIPNLRVHII